MDVHFLHHFFLRRLSCKGHFKEYCKAFGESLEFLYVYSNFEEKQKNLKWSIVKIVWWVLLGFSLYDICESLSLDVSITDKAIVFSMY